jgi:hypothetical protein
MSWRFGVASAAIALAPVAAIACSPALDGTAQATLQSDRHAVSLRTVPERIDVGKPFTVELAVCSKTPTAIERVAVDAHMPDHRHGMNYRPRMLEREAGRHTAQNLLFHMGGKWEILVDVRSGGRTERLAWPVVID